MVIVHSSGILPPSHPTCGNECLKVYLSDFTRVTRDIMAIVLGGIRFVLVLNLSHNRVIEIYRNLSRQFSGVE